MEEIEKLNKKPSYTDPGDTSNSDWTMLGRVGYEVKSPKPEFVRGTALRARDTYGFDDRTDETGGIGYPQDVGGVT